MQRLWNHLKRGPLSAIPSAVVLAVFALMLAWSPGASATSVAYPTLPDAAELLMLRGGPCDSGPAIWMELWDTDGDAEYAEIVRFGRGSSDPVVWVFYRGPEPLYAILTLPGLVPEKLTMEQLESRYGSPCDLPYGPVV